MVVSRLPLSERIADATVQRATDMESPASSARSPPTSCLGDGRRLCVPPATADCGTGRGSRCRRRTAPLLCSGQPVPMRPVRPIRPPCRGVLPRGLLGSPAILPAPWRSPTRPSDSVVVVRPIRRGVRALVRSFACSPCKQATASPPETGRDRMRWRRGREIVDPALARTPPRGSGLLGPGCADLGCGDVRASILLFAVPDYSERDSSRRDDSGYSLRSTAHHRGQVHTPQPILPADPGRSLCSWP